MSLSTFTVVHVVLRPVGIASGVLVLAHPSAWPKSWGLTGAWRATWVTGAATLLYLNAFIAAGT